MEKNEKKYVVKINTSDFSVKIWKNHFETFQSMKGFMKLIDGWKSTEYGKQIEWRIRMFLGQKPKDEDTLMRDYQLWRKKEKNLLVYKDIYDNQEFIRKTEVAPLGPKFTDASVNSILRELEKNGSVKISFSEAYGYPVSGMDDCFMEIKEVKEFKEEKESKKPWHKQRNSGVFSHY